MEEVVTFDRILKDLKMEDSIHGDSGKYRIRVTTKEELISSSTFTSYRPRIWPPQSELVEVAFIGKNQLLRAEVCLDECLKLSTVLLISLQSRLCDLDIELRLLC